MHMSLPFSAVLRKLVCARVVVLMLGVLPVIAVPVLAG
jgi:hypothetical protein